MAPASGISKFIIMNEQKKQFLQTEFIPLLSQLHPEAMGKWGVMNAQQMVEHFADAVKNASGKLQLPVLNSGETLVKYRAFLMSENPMNENTKNPLMPEVPSAVRAADMPSALQKLQSEVDYFFMVHDQDEHLKNNNPFFGELDYTQQVQLLHKHAMHHLKQFGLL